MRFKIRHHDEEVHFMRARFIVTPHVGHLITIDKKGHEGKYRVIDLEHKTGDDYDAQLTTLVVVKDEDFKGGHLHAVD